MLAMTSKEIAEAGTIIRVPIGSTIHGLHVEGTDDRDEMGVCIEPLETFTAFHEFEQYIYRTAAAREGRHDAPSRPGDLDLTIYGLRKFLRLAMQGNPTVLNLLFVHQSQWISGDARGRQLQDLTPSIISAQAGKRYLGYMEAQLQRLLGERGQLRVTRTDLIEAHGYDTKYAMHVLRLGYQGVELMETGRLTLPLPEPARTWVRSVRAGEVPLQDVLQRAGELERRVKDLLTAAALPAHPDEDAVQQWMTDVYWQTWRAQRSAKDTLRLEKDGIWSELIPTQAPPQQESSK